MCQTRIYLFRPSAWNPRFHPALPWALGPGTYLALSGTGRYLVSLALLHLGFDSMKGNPSVGTPSTQLSLGDVEDPGMKQTQLCTQACSARQEQLTEGPTGTIQTRLPVAFPHTCHGTRANGEAGLRPCAAMGEHRDSGV